MCAFFYTRRPRFSLALLLTLGSFVLVLISCGEPARDVAESLRLVDVYDETWLRGGSAEASTPPAKTEWRFDKSMAGWKVIFGVEGLAASEGLLVGRTTSNFSTLEVERTSGLTDDNPLEEVQVRMKVSAGQIAFAHFTGSRPNDLSRAIAKGLQSPWLVATPIEPSEELKTYIFKSNDALRSSDIHKFYLRPTDAADARFEIESVRLVFRREVLAEMASGVSWEGLSNVYREGLIARSPESVSWPLTLPPQPRLELALGTLDDRPVTFKISGDDQLILQRTVTTANRWDEVYLDLDTWAGREVTLRLSLEAEEPGTLGLWGTPVVRQRLPGRRRSERQVKAAVGKQPRKHPRGVIFVLADTLRPDRLQFYGHERKTAPHLEQLAAEGALFLDTQAQATWTKVSAPSIFTSLYPLSHGVLDMPDRLPSTAVTLAEIFRQAGYATLGFSSVTFTGKSGNMHQGYEVMHETVRLGQSKTARGYVDRLLPWLDDHRDQPFFVMLHVFDPHSPFEPDAPHDTAWADAAWNQQHRDQREKIRTFITDPLRQVPNLPNRDEVIKAGFDPDVFIERDYDWYDGSIRGMDQEIGRVLDRLAELGLEEDTLVVVLSDHGEEFHDHGRMFHGQSVYGELTHVPLILRYPGVATPGTVVDETVQLIDVMPTVLELAGLPVPEGVQGRSLVPLLSGNESGWRPRPAISHRAPMIFKMDPPLPSEESVALVFEGWKLVQHWQRLEGTPEFQLFDHQQDPFNHHDVAAQHPDQVERLAGLLADWRQQAEAGRLPSDAEAMDGMSQEELDKLRALGYVE